MTGLPHLLRLMGFELRRPKVRVRGTDVAGRVEAVGRDVTVFRPEDEVLVIVGGESGRWLGGTDRQLMALTLSPLVGQRLRTFIAKEKEEDPLALRS